LLFHTKIHFLIEITIILKTIAFLSSFFYPIFHLVQHFNEADKVISQKQSFVYCQAP